MSSSNHSFLFSKSSDLDSRAFDPLIDLAPVEGRNKRRNRNTISGPGGTSGSIKKSKNLQTNERKEFRDSLVQKLTKELRYFRSFELTSGN